MPLRSDTSAQSLRHRLCPPGTLTAAASGCVGATVFTLLGLPAPLLLGSMVFTLALALGGVRLAFPRWLQMTVLGVIGISVGSTLSSDLLGQMMVWLPSVGGEIITQLIALAVGSVVMHLLAGQTWSTAFLASFPGHLVMVLATANGENTDSRIVAIAQSLRLVSLVVFVPLVLGQADGASAHAAAAAPFNLLSALIVIGAGLIGMGLAVLIHLPTPLLLGGIIGAGAATLGGHTLGPLPHVSGPVLLLVVGTLIGARFSGMSRKALMLSVPRCALTVLSVLLTVALLAWPISHTLGLPYGQMLLAYTPGGGDVMPVLALAQGYDAVYVGIHHGARLLVMGFVLPLALRLPALRA